MARLRKEEQVRSYERLLNSAPLANAPFQRFSVAAQSNPIPSTASSKETDDEDLTFMDVNRQLALIANVLLSVVACSVALWMVASNWSAPRRLGLSMGGSVIVAVAEVVVYSGYLQRIQEAKEKSKRHVETKEIMQTWVIGKRDSEAKEQPPIPVPAMSTEKDVLRKRAGIT